MSSGILYITSGNDDALATAQCLKQNSDLPVTLCLPKAAVGKAEKAGLTNLIGITPSQVDGITDHIGGHSLIILGRFAPRAMKLGSLLDACLKVRVPLLSLLEDVPQLLELQHRHDEVRRAGLGVILAGGMIPALGAMMAKDLVSQDLGLTSLSFAYHRRGLGAGGGCYVRLQRQLSPVLTRGGSIQHTLPLKRNGKRALPTFAQELPTLAVSSPDVLGFLPNVASVEAYLALEGPALTAAIWASARVGEGFAKEASIWSDPEHGPLYGLRRKLNGAVPRQLREAGNGMVSVMGVGPFRTQRLTLRFDDARRLSALSISIVAAAMIAWKGKMGVNSVDVALSPEDYWMELNRQGFQRPMVEDCYHQVQSREARRLHILAP